MALNIFSRYCLGRTNLLVSNPLKSLAFKKKYSFQALNSLLISKNSSRSIEVKNDFSVGVSSKAVKNLSTEAGKIAQPRMRITFTCNVCSERLTRTFSKESYEKTVVLIKCPGCSNHHIIADNLGWFSDLNGKK